MAKFYVVHTYPKRQLMSGEHEWTQAIVGNQCVTYEDAERERCRVHMMRSYPLDQLSIREVAD